MKNVVGKTIKSLRKAQKMTQSELAEKLNISVPTLQRYENGVNEPKNIMVESIAKVFNVSPWYIITGANVSFEIDTQDSLDMENIERYIQQMKQGDISEFPFKDTLTRDILLALYDSLNPNGQLKAVDYVHDLTENPKYKK